MTIVHVLNSLTVGGLEKVVIDICNNTKSPNNRVLVITLSNKDLTLKSKLNKDIEIISLPFKNDSKRSLFSFWIFGIPKLIKILNKIKPDVVHAHLYYHYLLFLSISIKFSGLHPACFRTVHTSGLFYSATSLLNKFRCQIEKFALRINPTRLISISKTILSNNDILFSKYVLDNRLIPNGIDLNKFSKSNFQGVKKKDFGLQEDSVIVSYVSRLDIGKNHICLLNAWEQVVNEFPKAHLCLAGDGVLKSELINYIKLLGIEQKVSFLGTIDNIAAFLSITDIGVFPSQFEGFPISLIEKMAMELPVITSDIDIFKDVILNNENGLICSVNDSKDYADKLMKLISDKDLRIKIGLEARETVAKYDIKTIVNETIHFYEEALSI